MFGNNFLTDENKIHPQPYKKPLLEYLGDLRTLTLGGSPGFNDSGFGDPFNPFVGAIGFPEQDDVV